MTDPGYLYVSTPFFLFVLGWSVFMPAVAFVLGWRIKGNA